MDDTSYNKDRHYPAPSSLLSAVTFIQRLKLMETDKRSLDRDFVVLNQVVGFAEVGIKSAWHDSLIWIVGYVIAGTIIFFVQSNYLSETKTQILIWQLDGSPLYWVSKAASFSGLLFSTGMCVYMSRFYIGVACKKAVKSVFFTRAVFLMSFSLTTFILLNGINKILLTDEGIKKAAYFLSFIAGEFAANIYYFLHNYFRRALFEAAIVSLCSSIVSATVPFVSIFIFRVARSKEKILGLNKN